MSTRLWVAILIGAFSFVGYFVGCRHGRQNAAEAPRKAWTVHWGVAGVGGAWAAGLAYIFDLGAS